MVDKSIKIRAVIDETGFDQQIQKIEQKLSRLQKATGQIDPSSKAGQYAAKTYDDFRQSTVSDVQKKYDVNEKSLERLNRALDLQKRKYEDIQKLKKQNLDYDKEQEKIIDQRIQKLGQASRNRVMAMGEQQGVLGQFGQAAGGAVAGGGGMMSGMAGFSRLLTALAGSAILQGGLNVATTGYEEFGVTRPRKMQAFRGRALKGAGRETEEMMGGKGSDRFFWAQERSEAFRMAKDERQGRSNLDLLKGAGGMVAGGLAGAGAGAFAGATTGAALGSVVPGIGTAIGGVAGGMIGGISGMMGGGFLGAGERGRSRLFDKSRYNKMSLAEMMENRQGIEASLIAQDPTKKIARDYFGGNVGNIVDLQRRTGVRSDAGMFGKEGLLQTQMQRGQELGGRTLQQSVIEQNIRSMQSAGGQSNTATLSGFAGGVGRQFGVGNASQVMGGISGGGGLGAQQTEDAYKRLMIEAVRMGVDTSKMPLEMERMTQMTASIATAGGGFSKLAVETAGMGIGGLSKGEISAAGTAFQEFQATAKTGAGYEGQLGMGFLLGKKGEAAFGKSAIEKIRGDHKVMTMLNQFSAEDLEKNPELRKGLSEKLGINEEELIEGMGKLGTFKQTRTEEEETAFNQLGEMTKGMKKEKIAKLRTAETEEGQKYRELYTTAAIERAATRGKKFTGKGTFAQRATIGMIAGREAQTDEGEFEGAPMEITEEQRRRLGAQQTFEKQLTGKITGAAGEAELESRARGDLTKLEAVNEHIQNFEKAAEAVSGNSVKFNVIFEALNTALEANGNKMTDELEKLADQLEQMSNSMAQQGFISAKPGSSQ